MPAAWQRLPRPLDASGAASRCARPGALGRARADARGAATRSSASRDERQAGRRLRRDALRGPLAELDGAPRCVRSRPRSGRSRRRSAAGDALPRRPARACRRHAPLLRPHLDGALARGPRPVPRPPRRRVLRDDSRPPQGAPADTKHLLKAAARGLVPDRIIDKPKIGFFTAVDGWFRRRRAASSATTSWADPRYAESSTAARSSTSAGSRCGDRHEQRARAAVDPDARGLALDVSAALAQRRAGRERITVHDPLYAVMTPARDEVENLPRLAASLAAQTVPPDVWFIVDNGSTDGTLEIAKELAPSRWIRVLSLPGSGRRPRRPRRPRALGGYQGAATRPRSRQRRCGHLDGAGLLRAPAREVRRGRGPRDLERQALELREGVWEQRFVTGTTAWALRARIAG